MRPKQCADMITMAGTDLLSKYQGKGSSKSLNKRPNTKITFTSAIDRIIQARTTIG